MDKNIEKIKNELERNRDELRLKTHLFKKDAKDLWDSTGPKWDEFQRKYDRFMSAAEESRSQVGTSIGILGEELRRTYDRLRKAVQ